MFKSIRILALTGLLLPFAQPVLAIQVNSTLPAKVQQALKKNKIPQNSLSLVTLPLTGPGAQTIFNADVSVNPASTMKLITTYAALELLGPTYQWKTEFYTDGTLKDGVLNGNLYLKGGGDPKLNMEKLWLLMRDLRANGVLKITGDLVLDRSRFVHPQLPAFNDDGGDENKPFLVGPDSLLVNLKALRFIARADGGRASVAAEPPIESIRIDNQIKVTKAAPCPAWPDVRYNPVTQFDGTTVIASGSLPDGCSAQTYLSLLDHPPTPPARCGRSGRNWAAASSARTAWPACPRTPSCWRARSPRTWWRSFATSTSTATTPWRSSCSSASARSSATTRTATTPRPRNG